MDKQSTERSVGGDRDQMAQYLTTDEMADRYRTAPSTVRYWRMTGYGPKGVRVGRRVLYPMAEIERFDLELTTKSKSA